MKESLKLAVEMAKRGESEGFGTIYRETCSDVYFRARLMLGNRGEARDLVRQVYLVVFRTIGTLQDASRMEKWLYTVLYKLGERECQKKKGMVLEKEKTAPSWEGQKAPETTWAGLGIIGLWRAMCGGRESRRRPRAKKYECLRINYKKTLDISKILIKIGSIQ